MSKKAVSIAIVILANMFGLSNFRSTSMNNNNPMVVEGFECYSNMDSQQWQVFDHFFNLYFPFAYEDKKTDKKEELENTINKIKVADKRVCRVKTIVVEWNDGPKGEGISNLFFCRLLMKLGLSSNDSGKFGLPYYDSCNKCWLLDLNGELDKEPTYYEDEELGEKQINDLINEYEKYGDKLWQELKNQGKVFFDETRWARVDNYKIIYNSDVKVRVMPAKSNPKYGLDLLCYIPKVKTLQNGLVCRSYDENNFLSTYIKLPKDLVDAADCRLKLNNSDIKK